MDDKLNWKEHIGMIKSKLSKTITVIYRAKYLLDQNSLFQLYCTLLCHSNKLFCDIGILKSFDLIKLRISMIMFKANNELLPGNLQQFFNVKYTILHVTRQSNKLKRVCTNNFKS